MISLNEYRRIRYRQDDIYERQAFGIINEGFKSMYNDFAKQNLTLVTTYGTHNF